MKKYIFIFFVSMLFAQTPTNLLNEYQHFKSSQQQKYINYKKQLYNAFKEYQNELNKEFKNYKKELNKYWDNPELSSQKVFIEYSKDKKIKKKVDYQKNYIKIEVISNNKKEAKKKIAKALYSLITENTKIAFEKNPVLSKVNKKLLSNPKIYPFIKNSNTSNEPIVSDLIFNAPPTHKKAIKYSITQVKKEKIDIKPSKLPNNQIYSITIKLPPNSYLKKARYYKPDVYKRSNQFRLTPSLIYAIIHTESSFNPMARSYVPAFGLMQIVPQTGGADAYKMLTGKTKILSPSYLYNYHNNILIGSAYLNKIYYHYMKNIKNPISRLYCTIAAYNTGVGNVACAFNSHKKDLNGKTICSRKEGDYNIVKASKIINKLSPSQVYTHLIKNLRYDEAKNYLKKVSNRIIIYQQVISKNKI